MRTAQSLQAERQEGFTLEELEAETGISRSTIYRHAGSKEAILRRLALESGEPFQAENTRLRILRAARTAFGRTGLAAATMEQIAKAAGVGVATVYRHFGEKEDLIAAFIEEMTPRTTLQMMTLHPTPDLAGDLQKMVEAILAFIYENRDVMRLVFMGSESERHYFRSLRNGSDTTLSFIISYLNSQIESGRLRPLSAPEDLALALLGLILAFAVLGPLHYGTSIEDYGQSSRLIVSLFLGDLLSERR